MKPKSILNTLASLVILFLISPNVIAQCHYVPSTSTSTDTLSYIFSGGSFQSYGCAPIDPNYWMSGNGMTVTINFVHPQSHPTVRVWGMNDDDSASVIINGSGYPLTSSSAGYTPKVVCGVSPGPDGVKFANGKLVGANSNPDGNYSYQDVQFYIDNVASIKITGVSGAGWGFAGASVNCPLLSVPSVEMPVVDLFPNPTTGLIRLEGKNLVNKEVNIINELGKSMRRFTITGNYIDISDFPSGIYSMLININNQILIKRVIKI